MHAHAQPATDRHPPTDSIRAFVARWVLTTNHKEIGTLYLWLSFTLFFIAGAMAMLPALCLIGFGINAGIWINKYLMVMPAFAPDDRPFDHWLDVVLALGLLAGFVAAVVLLAGRFPLYSQWEIRLRPETRH